MEQQYILPLQVVPAQEFRAQLAQQNCTIRIFTRADCLFADLSLDDTVLRQGSLIIPHEAIFKINPRIFTGDFFMVNKKGNSLRWQDFGNDTLLYFAYDDGR